MATINEQALEAAILEHAAVCKKSTAAIVMWLIGILIALVAGVSSWAYNKSSQIDVLGSRVDGVEQDIGKIEAQLQALPRIEAKLDRAIQSN